MWNPSLFAAKGALFLDQHGPREWHKMVKSSSLHMSMCDSCILGQLYRSFANGKRHLSLTREETISLGFWLSFVRGFLLLGYFRLGLAWKRELASRASHQSMDRLL